MEIELIECMKTWQGEGPDTGRKMLLVRFQKCPYKCHFCDTMVKMNSSIPAKYDSRFLDNYIKEFELGIMITGGEPTYKENLQQTIHLLNCLQYFSVANVETNGIKLFDLIQSVRHGDNWNKIKFIFSPKFLGPESYYKLNQNTVKQIMNLGSDVIDKVFYKLVVSPDDNNEDSYTNRFLSFLISEGVPSDQIYLMPLGVDLRQMVESSSTVFDLADFYKVNITSRAHLVYGFI